MHRLSKSWKRGFDAARAASVHSNAKTTGMRVGAALFSGSNLLSFGYNDWNKTSPNARNPTYVGNVHAEVMALNRRWHYDKSKNLILYISRTCSNSEKTKTFDGCSRPCDNCMKAIKEFGISRIRYFDEYGFPSETKLYY